MSQFERKTVYFKSLPLSLPIFNVGQFKQFVQEMHYQTTVETNGKGCDGWDEAQKYWKQDPKYNCQNPGFAQDDNHPVVCVSWQDTQQYLD